MGDRIRTGQGDTIDEICFRKYGKTVDVVEMVYEANPFLSDHGLILPIGLEIDLPELEVTMDEVPIVDFWG